MWRPIMGYLLRMSAEIHDWLADLRDTDPAAAVGAGEALAALMNEGANLAAPLVAEVADPRRPADRPEQAAQAGQTAEQLAAAERDAAELRRLLPQMTEAEHRLIEQVEQLQARTEAFRARMEVLRATHAAARAQLLVQEAIAGEDWAKVTGLADDGNEAAARVRAAAEEIDRELGRQPWPEGLSELRAGAPEDSEIRILFAV